MTGSGAPLALPAEAFGEETGWRRRQHLVDALPYVDHITDEEREAAEKLIKEEVRFEQVDGRSRRGWKRGARERELFARRESERAGRASAERKGNETRREEGEERGKGAALSMPLLLCPRRSPLACFSFSEAFAVF